MDGYIVHGNVALRRGGLLRIEDGRGMLVDVLDGMLWITQSRDRQDYFVGAGQAFRLGLQGVTLAHATRRAVVTLAAPDPAHYARRITLTRPRSAEPVVLHSARPALRAWLDAYPGTRRTHAYD